MKTNETSRTTGRRAGSAMVTTMLTVTVVMAASGAAVAMAAFMPRMVRRQGDFIRAKAIAEAGINEAYSRLVNNFSLLDDPDAFPVTPFAGGSFRVTPHRLDEHTAILASVGRFGAAEARVAVDLRNAREDDGLFAGNSPWGHAIFANGNLQFHGTPPAVRGGMHTNQRFGLSGNPVNVEGTVTARAYNWTGGELPPEQIGAWQEIEFPQLTDQVFVDLFEVAKANGAVRSGGTYQQDDLAGVAGNVVWFTDSVTFHGSFDFDGYVVVAGNVTFRGSGTRTVDGLIYVAGNVTCNGSTDLHLDGAMLAGGNITFNGASSVFTYGFAGPPGVEPEDDSEDHVSVAVWRE